MGSPTPAPATACFGTAVGAIVGTVEFRIAHARVTVGNADGTSGHLGNSTVIPAVLYPLAYRLWAPCDSIPNLGHLSSPRHTGATATEAAQ